MDCCVMVDGVHDGSYAAYCDSPPAFNKHINPPAINGTIINMSNLAQKLLVVLYQLRLLMFKAESTQADIKVPRRLTRSTVHQNCTQSLQFGIV